MSNHSYLTQSYLIDEFAYVCVCNDGCSIVLNSFVMFGGGILWNTLIVQEISAKKKKKNTATNIWISWHWKDEKMDQTPYVQANSLRLKECRSVMTG